MKGYLILHSHFESLKHFLYSLEINKTHEHKKGNGSELK